MGCKFSKNNKVLPIVEPTRVWQAISPPNNPKKGLGRGRHGKKTRPVTRRVAGLAANDDAASPTDNRADDSHPTESAQVNESLNLHPLAGKKQSVDYGPIRLMKEAAACNRSVTPSTLRETPETLMIKRSSQRSLKSNPVSADSRDSGVSLMAAENNERKLIIKRSFPEKHQLRLTISQ